MPPYVPRKRPSPPPTGNEPPAKRPATSKSTAQRHSKNDKKPPVVSLDSKEGRLSSQAKAKQRAATIGISADSDDSSSSSSSESGSNGKENGKKIDSSSDSESGSGESSDSSSEDGIDWAAELQKDEKGREEHEKAGDMVITLDAIEDVNTLDRRRKEGKKYAPTKKEKTARISAHKMHVQTLMVHNLIRNHWCDDAEIQKILVDGLSPGCQKEVERWRKACGHTSSLSGTIKGTTPETSPKAKGKKGKAVNNQKPQNQRDWGPGASESQQLHPDSSRSDPALRLLKILSAYWKKKFVITAPGLRKQGYKDKKRAGVELKAWETGKLDQDLYGEQIKTKAHFKERAKRCQGSRDIGSQLFTALLRGLGMEARLIASLQPIGFGFTKVEEAAPAKKVSEDMEKDVTPQHSIPINSKGQHGVPRGSKSAAKSHPPARAKEKKQKTVKANVKGQNELSSSESELSSPPPSDDDSLIEVSYSDLSKARKRYDRDLPYPVYWTEVISGVSKQCIAVDPMVLNVIANNQDSFVIFEPRGAQADRAKQVMAYVIAFSSDNSAKDVTVRYLKKHIWPGKTKGVRYPKERLPIRNRNGKIKRHVDFDWFADHMTRYQRPSTNMSEADKLEDEQDLKPVIPTKDGNGNQDTETLAWYKTSAEFVLERHLRREEALLPEAVSVKQFQVKAGKGADGAKSEPVFRRDDVVTCRTVESWHKEGREVKEDAQPLKQVPMRAVTTIRKRQIEAAEAQMGGEKMMQGLYAKYQTDWIIPPPIENGVIPKNAFGNMDVYVPTMVPKGAIHIPLRGTAKVCRKLGIDHAEACTGFEFGNRMAVPVLTGVVVAREHENAVIDAWEVEQEQQRKREALKQEKANLGMWKRFMTGLRVLQRMKDQYGDDGNFNDSQIQNAWKDAEKKQPRGKAAAKKKVDAKAEKEVINIDSDAESHSRRIIKGSNSLSEARGFLRDNEGQDDSMSDLASHDGLILEGADSDGGKAESEPNSSKARQKPMSLAQMAADSPDVEETPAKSSEGKINGHLQSDNQAEVSPSVSKPKASGGRRKSKPKTNSSPKGRKQDEAQEDSASSLDEMDIQESKPQPSWTLPSEKKGRKSARQSRDAVHSHYFAESADELSDEGADAVKAAGNKKRRGGASARGRGRGRGRGRNQT